MIPPKLWFAVLAHFPLSYGYMIDNVVLLITGTLHDRDIAELKEKCHPLGRFPAMASISAGQNVSDLYNEVLIDTPLGSPLRFVQSKLCGLT